MKTKKVWLGVGWLICLILGPLNIRAQAPEAAKPDEPAAKQQPAPTIKSTTRLVQVSVVVTTKKGEPITGLTKDDFKILDESKPQEISFFSTSAPAPRENEAAALPPNAFTNRYDLRGEEPGAVIIILFDAENTATEDQMYLRKQVMALLRSLKAQDHVAIYALTSQLLVLHDFTQDDSALVESVAKFAPKEQTVFDQSFATRITFVGPSTGANGPWQNLGQALESPNKQISNHYLKLRMETTTEALKAIARHVAAIQGRKSLLWVSGGFPIQIGMPSIGRPSNLAIATHQPTDQSQTAICTDVTNQLACPEDETGTFDDKVKEAERELNRANVAIYPIDAHGVAVDPSAIVGGPGAGVTTAGRDLDTSQTTTTINAEQDTRDTSKALADGTGGVAFFGTNDVTNALKRAFDDSRYAYTIGFYPDHGDWNGKYRKIKVQVKASGAQLRYRNGYFADAEQSGTEAQAKAVLQETAMSPLEATYLGLIVTGKLYGPLAERKVELHVALDPKQLLLQDVDEHKKGLLDLYFVQRDAQGETVAAESQRIGLNLEEKQYEYLTTAGMVLVRHVTIAPNAAELRVLVRDAGSEALGSVTAPVNLLLTAGASPPSPPKLETPK
jgi:VWFA-related protein